MNRWEVVRNEMKRLERIVDNEKSRVASAAIALMKMQNDDGSFSQAPIINLKHCIMHFEAAQNEMNRYADQVNEEVGDKNEHR